MLASSRTTSLRSSNASSYASLLSACFHVCWFQNRPRRRKVSKNKLYVLFDLNQNLHGGGSRHLKKKQRNKSGPLQCTRAKTATAVGTFVRNEKGFSPLQGLRGQGTTSCSIKAEVTTCCLPPRRCTESTLSNKLLIAQLELSILLLYSNENFWRA